MVVMVDDIKFKNKLRFRKRPARISTTQSVNEETLQKSEIDNIENDTAVDVVDEINNAQEVVVEKQQQHMPNIKYRYDEIEKSQQDIKNYRGLILKENGMRVMLVSDPIAEKSAVCLSVEVGHMQDPPDIPG
jgi:hypothetical protein